MIEYYQEVLQKNPAYSMALLSVSKAYGDGCGRLQEHYLSTWAPVICEFAKWVVDNAKKREIKRLYFLSRDAYPVYQAALELCRDDQSYPILKYIRVSRYSLRIPEMAISKESFLDFLFLSGIDVTIRKIFKRGALSDAEIEWVSKEMGYTDSLDKVLARPEILFWKEEAKKRLEIIWPIVYEHAKPRLSSVLGYLRQEGMMEDGKIAIVDSGWVGTTQRSLKRLISVEKPGVELEGYYFGLYDLPKNVDKDTYHTFYFRPWKDIEKKVLFSNCLFEAVFSEDSGMTLSYEKLNDKYEPVIEDGKGMNGEFLHDMTNVAIDYAKALKESASHDNGVRVSEKILKKLMAYPDKWEAENYGRLKFCDDVLEYEAQDIAAELSYEDIKRLRLFRKLFIWAGKKLRIKSSNIKRATIHESGWLYASIVRCGVSIDWSLLCARMTQRIILYVQKIL